MKKLILAMLLIATPAVALDEDDAAAMCRAAIKERLKDASSATFGPRAAVQSKPGLWLVSRVVTARNSFGAKTTARFVCVIRDGKLMGVAEE